MQNITFPTHIQVQPVDGADHKAQITVSPCYPGYGTTLGNALRRVLLSSLPGAAATAIKIKGVDHEFSTVKGIKEDVVEIILNMKSLRFRVHSDEPIEMELTASGEGVITAKAFKANSQVEVINTDAVIATATDASAELSMKVIVQKGRGYIPVEERVEEKLDIGYIAIDAVYTPVRNVNYHTEHVRVGQMTNYDKLHIDVATDGTISPEEAFVAAAQILVDQFQSLTTGAKEENTPIVESEMPEVSTTEEEAE